MGNHQPVQRKRSLGKSWEPSGALGETRENVGTDSPFEETEVPIRLRPFHADSSARETSRRMMVATIGLYKSFTENPVILAMPARGPEAIGTIGISISVLLSLIV